MLAFFYSFAKQYSIKFKSSLKVVLAESLPTLRSCDNQVGTCLDSIFQK